jgi:ATPase family associated with various cellular activities (AAA)/AAA+ lid domain
MPAVEGRENLIPEYFLDMLDAVRELELLLQSGHGLIHIDTAEEERAALLLRHVTARLEIPMFSWSRVKGISRVDLQSAVYDTEDPLAAFRHVESARISALYHFRDLGPHIGTNALLAAQIKAAVTDLSSRTGCVIVTGSGVEFPPELSPVLTTFVLPSPSEEEYRDLITQIVRDVSERQHVLVHTSPEELTVLIRHLKGLTLMEAEKILTKAIIEDGALSADDIQHVIDAKKDVVEREGLLEYYPVEQAMTDIADLVQLKAWLAKRAAVVRDPEKAQAFGLTFPKGVLLIGVPGCGKSLSAKAVAAEWKLPLLKLDPSNLYNKFIGESEQNFKRAMAAAERMAPVVLWIDELEKAFASGGSEDGGVSQRILGSFLSWMQERRGDVFVVATANDISKLPPEFLRKGRFDEIFFVDLPDASTREEIFQIHLRSRKQAPENFQIAALAQATDGFSGSEIEEVVVAALYTAFSHDSPMDTQAITTEIERTRPLSVTMAERITQLREWAKDRAVSAN